jgi:hypothetical protein
MANEEYFECQGKFENYSEIKSEEFTDETYNEWTDRIFNEFRRKRFGHHQTAAATPEPPKASAPKMVLQLKPVDDRAKKKSQQDIYLVKFTKLFQSAEQISVKDLPFSIDSSPEKIVETILWAEDGEELASKNRLRDALRKWHPDKFAQLTEGRIKNEEEKKKVFQIVTHVCQALINYGK